MEVFLIDPSRLVADIVEYVAELKNTFRNQHHPISDDDTTLQRLCVKLETVLRHEQKEKYTLLGHRKDYWHFIFDCIPKDDGVKYVQLIPQMKTGQGKGRAFIRYALAHKTLADAIQRLLVNKNSLSSWYKQDGILRNPSLATALVNKLYDLNDVDFDLPCGGYDLDISWPAFSRRSFGEGASTGRRNSVSSMTSVDFRNERPDPLIGLAAEVASLKQLFAGNTPSATSVDNSMITDQPSISDLTLTISQVHQKAIKWKVQVEEEGSKSARDVKKAQDDRAFAIRESELKTKQILEKYVLLSKTATEESDAKCKDLQDKLSLAEKALSDREAELNQLRKEMSQSVISLQNAQREAIDFEKQLTSAERRSSELKSENEDLKNRTKSREQLQQDTEAALLECRDKISKLEANETEYKDKLSEASGNLKAKEVALESIQNSFEKLNGMVFGSFEELEAELKERLMEREKGLQSQSLENRKLELNVVELQQQLRVMRGKVSKSISQIELLRAHNSELEAAKSELQETLQSKAQAVIRYEGMVAELERSVACGQDSVDASSDDKPAEASLDQRSNRVVRLVNDLTKELSQTMEECDKNRTQIDDKDMEIERLRTSLATITAELNATRGEKENLETELCTTKEQLINEAATQDTLRSELSQVTDNIKQCTLELSTARDDSIRLEELVAELENNLEIYKEQIIEITASEEHLKNSLSTAQDKVELLKSEKTTLEECQKRLEDEISALQDKQAVSSYELTVAKQQLEAANEGRIRAEHAQLKVQDKLESLQCTMEQEVAALKFQLSSETMKYETEIMVLSTENQESARHKERVAEQDDVIANLESKLKERGDAWLVEKRKYTNDIKHLKTEVQLCKSALDGHKQKVMSLENDLLLKTKQLEKELAHQEEANRKITDIEEQRNAKEKQLMDQMSDMERDSRELKDRLIGLTQEKASLWRKADDMAHEIRIKASDRWVADEEVKNCTECKAEFSFLLRKHHCRMCGRIFCHSCVNNWVRTPHSRKVKRVCSYCLLNDKQIRRTEGGDYETMSDISADESRRSISVLSITNDDEMRDSPNQTTNAVDDEMRDYPNQATNAVDDEMRDSPNQITNAVDIITAHTNEEGISEPVMVSTPNQEDKIGEGAELENTTQDSKYTSLTGVKTSTEDGDQESVTTPEGEGYEVIDPHEDMEEQPETRVTVSDSDTKAEPVIPAVNDEEGISYHEVMAAGVRYILPVIVGTPGVTLCWTFSTVYKSVIFGVAYKHSENTPDEDLETILPLSRYSSHQTAVQGDWKVTSPGVYLLVFDNTFSRFTSKQLTCEISLKRRPSLLETDGNISNAVRKQNQ